MKITTTNSLTGQAFQVFSASMIQFVIKFATPILLVRLFTQEEYGIYQQILLLAMTLFAFIDLGYTNSLYYLYSKNNKDRHVVTNLFLLLNLTGWLFLPVFLIWGNDIIDLIVKEPESLVGLIVPVFIYAILYALSAFLEATFVVQQRTRFYMYFSGVTSVLRLLILVGVVYYTRSLEYALYALILYQVMRLIYSFFYLIKHFGWFSLSSFKISLKPILSYSLPLGTSTAAETFNNRITSLILLGFLSPVQYAIYAVGTFRLPLINMLLGSITSVSIPKITHLYEVEKDHDRVAFYWNEMTTKLIAMMLPLLFYFGVMAGPVIIILFTDTYTESINIFRIILLTLPIYAYPATAMLRAFGRAKYLLYVNLFSLIFSAGISYALIIYYDLYGAALAIVFITFMIWLMYLIKVKMIMKISFFQLLSIPSLLKVVGISIIGAIPVFFIDHYINNNLLALLISALIYFPLTYFLLRQFKIFDIMAITKKILKR